MRHTISVLVENKFGVLARVAGMFSGRGFNIDTLNVGPTNDPKFSCITVTVRGDDQQSCAGRHLGLQRPYGGISRV